MRVALRLVEPVARRGHQQVGRAQDEGRFGRGVRGGFESRKCHAPIARCMEMDVKGARENRQSRIDVGESREDEAGERQRAGALLRGGP